MDYDWTPKSVRPEYLYRVMTPRSHCRFDSKFGLVAKDIKSIYYAKGSIDEFLASVDAHRRGKQIPSPYISFFADKDEAESWTLAAGQLYGNEHCTISRFYTGHEMLRDSIMWFCQDIQRRSSEGFTYPYAGLMGPPPKPLCQWPKNSEWLILWAVPQGAMCGFKCPNEILAERALLSRPHGVRANPRIHYHLSGTVRPSQHRIVGLNQLAISEEHPLYDPILRRAVTANSVSQRIAPRSLTSRNPAPRNPAPRVSTQKKTRAPRVSAPRVSTPRVSTPRVSTPRNPAPRNTAPRVFTQKHPKPRKFSLDNQLQRNSVQKHDMPEDLAIGYRVEKNSPPQPPIMENTVQDAEHNRLLYLAMSALQQIEQNN